MFCVKCFYPTTQVTNSRGHKKHPSVWRRRHCPRCGQVFTTDERPRLKDTQAVWNSHTAATSPFNPGILLISIADAFGHDPKAGKTAAWDLMETVIQLLAVEHPESLSTDDIAAYTHQVIERYDSRAGLQYGLQHDLITARKPRKR